MKKKMMVLGLVLATSASFAGAAQAMEMSGDTMMKKDAMGTDSVMQKDAKVMELMKQVEALNAQIMMEKDKMMKKDGATMSGDTMMKKDAMGSDSMMHTDTMMSDDLTEGSRGDAVMTLQTFLEEHGYLMIPAGVAKGYFGPLTKAALAKYQKSVGLNAAGFYGPLTRAMMSKAMMMKKDGAMIEGDSMKKDDAMMKKTQ
ncbi:peptidoglycan-binding protein [Candidatus Kaiserbacteria bacterium]|nr:peptidoglycan-binding protein [Candidatus Kaiserbacteria bacterium]